MLPSGIQLVQVTLKRRILHPHVTPRGWTSRIGTTLTRNSSHSHIAERSMSTCINTKEVESASSRSVEDLSESALRQLMDSPEAVPLLFSGPESESQLPNTGFRLRESDRESLPRAKQLVDALKASNDRLVEIEHGRYDHVADGQFDRVEMPLSYYIDWLESSESGTVGGKQLYLAQWRAGEDIEAVQKILRRPTILKRFDRERTIDSYGTNFFIGPTGAVTPLHYDPYINLFHLQASSDPRRFAKHVTLFPPALSYMLKRDTNTALRNTSSREFTLLRQNSDSSESTRTQNGSFEVRLETELPVESVNALSGHALTCVVREGDTLLIPKRWWHRVENVDLAPDSGSSDSEGASKRKGAGAGWTAAVSWWFLLGSHDRLGA